MPWQKVWIHGDYKIVPRSGRTATLYSLYLGPVFLGRFKTLDGAKQFVADAARS